jgi:hypothetical protein
VVGEARAEASIETETETAAAGAMGDSQRTAETGAAVAGAPAVEGRGVIGQPLKTVGGRGQCDRNGFRASEADNVDRIRGGPPPDLKAEDQMDKAAIICKLHEITDEYLLISAKWPMEGEALATFWKTLKELAGC